MTEGSKAWTIGRWAVLVSASLALHVALFWWWAAEKTVDPLDAPKNLIWIDVQPVTTPPEPEPRPAEAPPTLKRRPKAAAIPVDIPPSASPRAPAFSDAPTRLPELTVDDWQPSQPAPSVREVEPVDAGTTVNQKIAQWARQALGEHRAKTGNVHTYYATLGKALLNNWDAERPLKSTGLKAFGEQLAQNSRVWNEIWQRHAQTFGASGSPFVDVPPADRRVAIPNERSPIGTPDLVAKRALNKQMRDEFKATRRATVRVTQASDGKLMRVELLAPSHDAAVDREAVADIRSAAERLPPPPPEIAERNATLVSVWQFELVISITPPIPTFSFEFDEALGFIDARLPLDRRLYKRVRLISVE